MTSLLFGDRCLAREGHCPPLPDGDRRTYSAPTSPGTFAGSASLGEGLHHVHDRDSPTVNANFHGWWKRGHLPKPPRRQRAGDRGHHQGTSKGGYTDVSLKPKTSSTKQPFRWSAKQLRPPEESSRWNSTSTTKCTRPAGASRSLRRSGTTSRCKWPRLLL